VRSRSSRCRRPANGSTARGSGEAANGLQRSGEPSGTISESLVAEQSVNLGQPPDADPHVRWCERTATQLMGSLLLDYSYAAKRKASFVRIDAGLPTA